MDIVSLGLVNFGFDFVKSVANGLGNRLSSGSQLTPFEKAQTEAVRLNGQRFEEDMRNFKERMAADRANQLATFRRQEIDHGFQLEKQRQYFDLMQWPLENLPHEIIGELNSFPDPGINLIICATENEFFSAPHETKDPIQKRAISQTIQKQYINTLRDLNYWVTQRYPKGGTTHLVSPHIISERRKLNPHAMAIKLRNHLRSEPCIFVHLDVRSLERTPIYVALWGMTGGPRISDDALGSIIYEGVHELRIPPIEDMAQKAQALDFTLKTLLAGLIDLSFLTYLFDDPERRIPLAPGILLRDYPEALKADTRLFTSYDPMLDKVAEIVPDAATQAMLDLVEQFQRREPHALAQHYFSRARDTLAKALQCSTEGSAWHDTTMLPSRTEPTFVRLINRLRHLRSNFGDVPPEMAIAVQPSPEQKARDDLNTFLRSRTTQNFS